jgi:hypothetical protein
MKNEALRVSPFCFEMNASFKVIMTFTRNPIIKVSILSQKWLVNYGTRFFLNNHKFCRLRIMAVHYYHSLFIMIFSNDQGLFLSKYQNNISIMPSTLDINISYQYLGNLSDNISNRSQCIASMMIWDSSVIRKDEFISKQKGEPLNAPSSF